LILTGKLGDVMKESASTALTFIKSNAAKLKIDTKLFEENDFHLHVPEGAVPKDGPSAGITILSALTSLLLDKPIKSHLAMTGEITLRGKVLPVGGIKEKILAAKRSGMKEIVMSTMNRKDVEEIKEEYIKSLKFHYVDRMEEVLKIVLA
jgi:ATP-dependent Lon protease